MRILTITLHSLQNPGSALQAFALQHFLRLSGYETQIIDYRPSYVSTEKNKFRVVIGKILFFPHYFSRTLKFKRFIAQYMNLTTERYKSYNELDKKPPKADVYIAGSDQIWNSSYDCGKDKAFYLGFVNSGKKMSYAASIGKELIPQEEVDWITGNIKDFHFISVREQISQTILNNNGANNVTCVCDPVLLVNEHEYKKMAADIPYEKFVAIYLVNKSEILEELISTLKNQYGYKIILIGGFSKRCSCDIHIKDMGPSEFLGLISNAEFVISSSFHATLFSLIFRKKFAVLLPKSNGARMEHILKITGLEDRILKGREDINNLLKEIDYEVVSEKLQGFVENSKNELISNVEATREELPAI